MGIQPRSSQLASVPSLQPWLLCHLFNPSHLTLPGLDGKISFIHVFTSFAFFLHWYERRFLPSWYKKETFILVRSDLLCSEWTGVAFKHWWLKCMRKLNSFRYWFIMWLVCNWLCLVSFYIAILGQVFILNQFIKWLTFFFLKWLTFDSERFRYTLATYSVLVIRAVIIFSVFSYSVLFLDEYSPFTHCTFNFRIKFLKKL